MIGCMLLNKATGRYHPIFFRPAPMPSGADSESGMLRHRSYGHHTDGFSTLEEAVGDARSCCGPGSGNAWDGSTWEWSGEGVPALTAWFPASLVEAQWNESPVAEAVPSPETGFDALMALPSLLTVRDVPWLFLPNRVDLVASTQAPPEGLSRTAFAVLLAPGGHVLMAHNRRRGLEFPGGHVEAGETAEQGVVRECREEVGVEPSGLRPFLLQRMVSEGEAPEGWHYPHPVGFQRFYVGRVEGAPPSYEENDECLRPVLLSCSDAMHPDTPLSASQRTILMAALSVEQVS